MPKPWVNDVPSSALVRDAVRHLLESRQFKASPRLAAFLEFIVEAALTGRSASIKGYTIGVEALGRPETFDPSSDSIVRVEAVRLRAALRRFYQDDGAKVPVEISLPAGTYVPNFSWLREETASREERRVGPAQFARSKADLTMPVLFSAPAGEIIQLPAVEELRPQVDQAIERVQLLRGRVAALALQIEAMKATIRQLERLLARSVSDSEIANPSHE